MIIGNRDVKQARITERGKSEPRYDERPAEIVSVDGSTAVSGAAGYVWVREYDNGTPAPALNIAGVITEAGTPVIVRRVSKPTRPELHIVSLYTAALPPGSTVDIDKFEVAKHRENHQWATETTAGPDALKVYQPALMPLKTTYDGTSLTVGVNALFYALDGGRKYFPGQAIDLTANVPATSGQARRVLLYLDTATNQITKLNGGLVTASLTQPPFPDCPAGGIPSAYITLTNGDTAVVAADYVDARQYLSPVLNSSVNILNNYGATAAPTSADDSAAGYSVGSNFVRTNGEVYKCYYSAVGSAQWSRLDNVGTNLSAFPTSVKVTVGSSTGTNVDLVAATTSLAGVMTAADKTTLDALGEGAHAFNSTTQNILTATGTTATFDSEFYDDNSFHSTSVNTGRLTIPTTGRYTAGFYVEWESNASGERLAVIRQDGSTLLPASYRIGANPVNTTRFFSATDQDFTGGSYLELRLRQDSGSTLAVTATFWIKRIR